MPGATGIPHHTWRRLVAFAQEAGGTFGTAPAGGPDGAAWTTIPILGDGFKLKATSPWFRPETNYGGYTEAVGVHHQQIVTGPWTTLAFPLAAYHMGEMALVRDATYDDVHSYTFDYYTPVDPRQYLGAVVETLTLRVTGTGDQDVQLEAAMRAQQEVEADALAENEFGYTGDLVPFMFRDARIRLNGAHVSDVEAFTLTIDNRVAQGPMRRTVGPDNIVRGCTDYLIAGRRLITLDLDELNNDDLFNELIRDNGTISFEARFDHPAGHIWQIQLGRVVFEESEESTGAEEPTKEAPRGWAMAGPGEVDIVWEVDMAAHHASTTTLAWLTTTAGPAPTTTTVPA